MRNYNLIFVSLFVCIFFVSCKEDESDSAGGEEGDSCLPGEPDTCGDGLVCFSLDGADPVCMIGCDPAIPDACEEGTVCEQVQGGAPMCALPVQIVGHVLNNDDDSPIEGALVQARDSNGAATGASGVTDADGMYSIEVPAVRDAEGTPLESIYTLGAQASGFYLFPTAVRPALPLDAMDSVVNEDETGLVIENAITTIKLMPLPAGSENLGTIKGTVAGDNCSGVLVVAEAGDGAEGHVGFSDSLCVYTIFNVPAGDYTVTGYAAGVQLVPATATVTDATVTEGADLAVSENPLSTVSGSVNIVNAPGGSVTSVILAVESTFMENSTVFQVPPGLRVGEVSGAFEFTGVPDGRYVVLAAYENDLLVRDPDTSIGGTSIVHIEVPSTDGGNEVVLPESFKVTEALAVVSPGAEEPELVSGDIVFEWVDDSSEKSYDIEVLDALGNQVWTMSIDGVSGGGNVTLPYDGPALETGMYYQFKVTSIGNDGVTPISTTEDLLGVFYL